MRTRKHFNRLDLLILALCMAFLPLILAPADVDRNAAVNLRDFAALLHQLQSNQ